MRDAQSAAQRREVAARDYPLKRAFDIAVSVIVLAFASPLILGSMLAVWLQDRHSPFYRAARVARCNADFTMLKIRSMVVGADKTGVNSTGANDNRITAVGRFIRRYKVDELSQFINVVRGDMSVVGPRPNTRAWGVDLYTPIEMDILSVRPGVTDLSSIIFSDEGDILKDEVEADLTYNRIIRPWKSQLGLFYIEHMSFALDCRIAWLTFVVVFNKPRARRGVVEILERYGADPDLIAVCRRQDTLRPAPPPGSHEIETGLRGHASEGKA